VHDELEAIARRWGVFTSAQVNVTRKGASGIAAIRAMMDRLRASPPRRIGQDDVLAVSDYDARTRTDLRTGATSALTLPRSNVLAYELASGSRVIARPSGTEPKAKFYFDVREEVDEAGDRDAVAAAGVRARARMERLVAAFTGIVVSGAMQR
jgi:phosphomannomutase